MSRRTPTYDEIYMRELISESFRLGPLNLGDKPDMISPDKMLGIEVAACIPEEKRKANSLIEKQYHTQLKENESLWLYHYKKNKLQLKSGPDNKLYVKILKERIVKKIEKHKNYIQTNKFGLALYTEYVGTEADRLKTYQHIFKKFNTDIDFLIIDITNDCTMIYIDKQKTEVFNYAQIQFDVAEIAYEIYQHYQEKEKTQQSQE